MMASRLASLSAIGTFVVATLLLSPTTLGVESLSSTTTSHAHPRRRNEQRRRRRSHHLYATTTGSAGADDAAGRCAAPTSSADDDEVIAPSNRVFVAGISRSSTERTIRETFSEFGTVDDVLIVGTHRDDAKTERGRSPYCFVTFDDVASAREAIAASSSSTKDDDDGGGDGAYTEVQFAKPKDDSRRTRSNLSRAKEEERRRRIESYCCGAGKTDLIVQVQSTHLDRLVDYLLLQGGGRDDDDDVGTTTCRVVGSSNSNSKNVSLLFLSCADPIESARSLQTDPLLARAVNKSYVVRPGSLVEGNLETEGGCVRFAENLFDEVSRARREEEENEEEEEKAVLRIQVYPPKDQPRLLRAFDGVIDEKNDAASGVLTIAPRGFTHIVSVVEVYRYKGRRGRESRRRPEDDDENDENERLYMIGTSPATPALDVVDTNNVIAEDNSGGGEDDVSRAYYKLREALGKYEADAGNNGRGLHRDLHGCTALDCGAAPGGWTKCLIERLGCPTVYSVDPGALSPSVSKLRQVRHVREKIQDALPKLLEDESAAGRIKVWVSDMCLHDMREQVDLLLLAKGEGLLAPDAFFVLTLKCVVGHSRASYDRQVESAVEKLRDVASSDVKVEGLEIFHLFSNRSGERTVMGYIR